MRVLVCGGRDYADQHWILTVLTCLHAKTPVTTLIHGDAGETRTIGEYVYTVGADRLAGKWALASHVPVAVYPADWAKYGRSAGPRRNQQMLVEAKPDLVVAFPGGRGTKDMVLRAREAGVEIFEPGESRA